ncbi:MAG: isocitrate dehydrogenase (NAD(+)) [Candidatus Sumerlaeaceae bacterium]|nr:isocitrate dehydrogenase (NAD(+)) [Candidatus Sumerlaeaceae bacterium]
MTGKRHVITLIPGDGIGPEVVGATVRVVEALGLDIVWEEVEAGGDVAVKYGSPVPEHVFASVRKNGVALKGPITTPVGAGFPSANVTIRKKLGLYANVRPARSLPAIKTRFEGVDLVVVRENTEDLYSGLEHIVVPGVVESLKIITEEASLRVGRFAFDYARRNGRKLVTAVHKANIMKLSDGLFLECTRRASKEYPEIEYREIIVDNLCMQLVTNPCQFDVLLLENLYGDIISDLCAGLVGGLGVVPAANIGPDLAVFEAVHGSAPDIAGRGIANPTAVMFSAVMMLRYLGETDAAARMEAAIIGVLDEGKTVTRDLGGTASTKEYADAVIARLKDSPGCH